MGQQLPRNVGVLVDLLAEQGPTGIDEVESLAETAGVRMRRALLEKLPSKFPGHIHWQEEGVLAAGARPAQRRRSTDKREGTPVWLTNAEAARVTFEQLVVIDIETDGLDPETCAITSASAISGTGTSLQAKVQTASTEEATILWLLDVLCRPGIVVVGHDSEAFDLPFIARRAREYGLVLAIDELTCVDTLTLSVLALPTLPSRRLSDLCRHFDIARPHPDPATDNAAAANTQATLAVLESLLGEIDSSDPSWQLASRCLEAAGSGLCSVLPVFDRPSELRSGLIPNIDPLVSRRSSPGTGAQAHVSRGLTELSLSGTIGDRPSQRRMANLVAAALDAGNYLAVEAPTGTGKTLAYLLAAVGQAQTHPVVVATATRVLQDQIRVEAERLDAHGLLPTPVRHLQGVSNYLCPREISDALGADDYQPDELMTLAVAVRGLAAAQNGVWDEISDASLSNRSRSYQIMRQALRTDSRQCDRGDCEFADICPLMMRLDGLADHPGVIVANHALLAAWITPPLVPEPNADGSPGNAETEGFSSRHPGALVSAADTSLIFDEAHDLEDSLTNAWTEELSEIGIKATIRQLAGRHGLLRDLRFFAKQTDWQSDLGQNLADLSADVRLGVDALGDAIREYVSQFGRNGESQLLKGVSTNRPEFRAVAQAAADLRLVILNSERCLDEGSKELHEVEAQAELKRRIRRRLWGLGELFGEWAGLLGSLKTIDNDHALVHLLTIEQQDAARAGSWTYRTVPIEIGPLFKHDVVDRTHCVVLTSATLRAGGAWTYLQKRLGIAVSTGENDEAESTESHSQFAGEVLESPFDFRSQSMAILTNHLPVPTPATEQEFVEDMAADQVGFLSLSGGKTLSLFAARTRMEAVADLVRTKEAELAERDVRLLVQGEVSRNELVETFRDDQGAVAFGLRSFWQGFDAPGETLSYLFIEKPPYPHPDDPIIGARQKRVQEQGGDPFMDYIAPKTAVLFAQGFGRLIRSENDRGAAFICDRRLQAPSSANRLLLDSLPGPTIKITNDRDHAWASAIEFVTGEKPDVKKAIALEVNEVGVLLESLRIRPGDDPAENLTRAAVELFGLPGLRPEQLQLMLAFLDGRDVLGVLPTGFGKSLCFQLPALLCGEDKATVVVSPLVALIKDQVDDLRGRRRLRPVQGITGATSAAIRTEILRDVALGRVRLLYVSPERLVRDPVLQRALAQQDLSGLVIDEAHCVSVWGHDFRPEFRQIPKAVASFRRVARMGLTATATAEVADDIVASAELDDPLRVRLPADRSNLHLWVQMCDSERHRARELLRIATHFKDSPGIVYASTRATSEELANLLRRAGFNARHYHAGMVTEQREAIQEQFLDGLTEIIVATKAFGMGINKPDIGWVVHFDLPDSLDGYAQEAGRAARSPELTGHCVLMYTKRDLARRRAFLRKDGSADLMQLCETVLREIDRAPSRAGDRLIDPQALAEAHQELEVDDLNRAVAWLERIGCIERKLDCSSAGMLTLGFALPDDEDERRELRTLAATLNLRAGVRRRIVFEELQAEGFDPDRLEELLVRWTLARVVTFTSSQRLWRIARTETPMDPRELAKLLERWSAWQHRRLDAMITYATVSTCRRTTVARHFGDEVESCEQSGRARCDVCAAERGPWFDLPDAHVPDPEELIDVRVELLRGVDWASRFTAGNYGEATLKRALLGSVARRNGDVAETKGIMSCPQLGALKHLRNGAKRLDEDVEGAIRDGQIERATANYLDATYQTLVITASGRELLDRGRGQKSHR